MSEVAGGGDGGDSHLLALLVKSRDEPGVLYRVSEVMYRHSANISYVSTIGGGEIQFELEGVADHAALVDELRRLDPVRSVEIVPSFGEIFGKRVIVIGGGAQVAQVAQGAVTEADRHNIRGERISVDTMAIVGEDKLVLAGALMGGDISNAVQEIRAQGIIVICTSMAGSVPEACDLVVTDSLEAGVMAVMLIADTAKFSIDEIRGRRY
ncbi:MAG: hypothetical protein E6J02_03220 [Chloroflexi bacterium]|nr:MAG: hypothetical protein E6J02_03220 [Chloroflexota bacterium]